MSAQHPIVIDSHFIAPDGSRSQPSKAQAAFMACLAFVVAIIGGYGSGKTEALLRLVMRVLWRYPGYSVILVSDTFPHVLGLLTRLCRMGMFPEAYEGQPATARDRIFGRRKSPVIRSASYEERHIVLTNGSEIRIASASKPETAEGWESHMVAWDEATLGRFNDLDRDHDAWHILTSRARAAPKAEWGDDSLVPMGVRMASVPRGGECRQHLEGGRPCMGKHDKGPFAGVRICHNVPDRIVIHASTRSNLSNLSPAYQRQIELMNPLEADAVLNGDWLTSGTILLPGWDRILIPWEPDPNRAHHIAADPGKRTGHALLLEEVSPDDPAYPKDRADGRNPVYVIIDEARSPTQVPEAFAILCFEKWAEYHINRVVMDQAGLQSMHTRKSRAKRRESAPDGSHVKAWNYALLQNDNPRNVAPRVEFTTDKSLTNLEVSVPMLADWILNARGHSRYFVAEYLKGKDYGRIQDRSGGILYGVHPQGEEYCRDEFSRIPMRDKGRGHHGIDALRYHRIRMDPTRRGELRTGRTRRGRGI